YQCPDQSISTLEASHNRLSGQETEPYAFRSLLVSEPLLFPFLPTRSGYCARRGSITACPLLRWLCQFDHESFRRPAYRAQRTNIPLRSVEGLYRVSVQTLSLWWKS